MRAIFAGAVVVSVVTLGVFLACGRDEPPPPHCACQDHHDHEGAAPEGAHAGSGLPALAPLPDTSIYQLENGFTDQDDQPFVLSSLRGGPALVVMFYGSCTSVCPLILSQALRVDQALSETERARLHVVLVTFDPENDTPERLRALAAERGLPLARWSLLRGDDDAVRELAMALGVQYRRTADGGFVHSAMVTLLDAEGRVVIQTEGVDASMDALTERTRALTAPAPATP